MLRPGLMACVIVALLVTALPADDAPADSYTAGTLINERGEPESGAWVRMIGVQRPVAHTDAQGRFRQIVPPDLLRADCLVGLENGVMVRGGIKSADPLVVEAYIDRVMLQGIWDVVTLRNDGRLEQPIERFQVFIDARRLAFRQHGRLLHNRQYDYSFDPENSPPHFNLKGPNVTIPGIYTRDEDELQFCFNENNDQRPTAYRSTATSANDLLLVLEPAPETQSLDSVTGIDDPGNEHFRDVLIYTAHAEFRGNPLQDVLSHLSLLFDTTFEVAPGVDREMDVELYVEGISLHTSLLMLLTPYDLRYVLRDGKIIVESDPAD